MGWHCHNCGHWIVDEKFKTCTYCGASRSSHRVISNTNPASSRIPTQNTPLRTISGKSSSKKIAIKIIAVIVILLIVALTYTYRAQLVQIAGGITSGISSGPLSVSKSEVLIGANAVANQTLTLDCLSQVNSAIKDLLLKLPNNSSVQIVNVTSFSFMNKFITIGSNTTTTNNTALLNTYRNQINDWVGKWSYFSYDGFTSSINCENSSDYGAYICKDFPLAAAPVAYNNYTYLNNGKTIVTEKGNAVGVAIRVVANYPPSTRLEIYPTSAPQIYPLFCRDGALLQNSASLLNGSG